MNKILHAYMFVGECSTTSAKEFAKEILNEKTDIINNPDFSIIEAEESTIKIEQIRSLTEKIYEKPIKSNRKVYIICDAERLTTEASNCILKTLEEPPDYATIILTVKNEYMLLPTIRSRCTKKTCNKPGEHVILPMQSQFNEIDNLFNNFENQNIIDFYKNADIIYKSEDNILEVLDYIIKIIFIKLKQTKNLQYVNYIEVIEKAKKNIKANANFNMTIDNMIFNLKGAR